MTPMMEQWSQLKAQAGDALLFFRLGDFYELFDQDAVKAAPIMGVALTSRNSKAEDSTALCGVPIHQFQNYLQKLLNHGLSVALAEQVEEASAQKKLVRREIVQFFTPGIRLLEDQEKSSFAAVLLGSEKRWTLAAADVATGQILLESGSSLESIQDLIERGPILDLRTEFGKRWNLKVPFEASTGLLSEKESQKLILESFQIADLADAPCSHTSEWVALGSLIRILKEAHPQTDIFLKLPSHEKNLVAMNAASRRHLHLFEPEGHSLFDFLNETQTALGRRQLRSLISAPTQDLNEIRRRQNEVQFWKEKTWLRKKIREQLGFMNDIDRILRLKNSPQRLLQLQKTLQAGFKIFEILKDESGFAELQEMGKKLLPLSEKLSTCLEKENPREGAWIASGVQAEIDELRNLQDNAEQVLLHLENQMRQDYGVSTLKIKFHQVFGYVAEVTRQHAEKIPSEMKIVQSLANAIRFKTDKLKELEEKLLSLESRLLQAEQSVLEGLYDECRSHRANLEALGASLAEIDCFQSWAEVSIRESWVQPEITTEDSVIQLEKISHPLSTEDFVPLSFELDQNDCRLMLLTGPNMAGKSTVLRLAGMAAILMQIGCDVPAKRAKLSVFDRIMCRMGALDDLTQGKSTFFIEMREVASMLQGATEKSLLLFDEIGRGTSTFDGMSLAWAITEFVHEERALSMIATHYLELAELEDSLRGLKNFHLGVREIDNQLVFTRRLESGPANQSYGIQVARLAAVHERILKRASEKLKDFESKPQARSKVAPLFEWAKQNKNMKAHEEAI